MATTDSDPASDRVFTRLQGDVTPTVAVVRGVSAAVDLPVEELPPLSRVVDPDSLNAVGTPQSADSDVTVSFTYANCEVTVRADGPISIDPLES